MCFFWAEKIKDRKSPQVNFFQEAETTNPAGRGRKDRQRRWWRIDELKGCMWRLVCDKLCVKDRVWQKVVRKMVCDNVACDKVVCVCVCVCEGVWRRWCVKESVTKMCVEDVVCSRWYVTKLCVKDGACVCVCGSCVWRMVCVCETSEETINF